MPRFEIIDGKCVVSNGVTEILESEFMGCRKLREVVFPDTVVSIGAGAFFWCTSLRDVNIPESVVMIGSQAFEGCAKLKSIRIPEGVKELNSTFYQCSSLAEISIPRSVIKIGHNTFSACTNLKKIEIAEGNLAYKSVNNCCLTKDGKTLVFGCSKSIIPEGVEYIGNYSFGDCGKLESVSLPQSVRELKDGAFYCTSIKDLTIAQDDPNKRMYLYGKAVADGVISAK